MPCRRPVVPVPSPAVTEQGAARNGERSALKPPVFALIGVRGGRHTSLLMVREERVDSIVGWPDWHGWWLRDSPQHVAQRGNRRMRMFFRGEDYRACASLPA